MVAPSAESCASARSANTTLRGRTCTPRYAWMSTNETEAARKVGPRIVIGDELGAGEGRELRGPIDHAPIEFRDEPRPVGDDAVALGRDEADQSLGNAEADDLGVLGIEPIVRIADAV